MFQSLFKLLRESREELRRVIWPTRASTFRMVFTVILISLAVAAFLGLWDMFFIYLLEKAII